MRNPIMAAELLVIWAEVLYLSSWGVVLYAAAITAAAHVMVVCVEEPELRDGRLRRGARAAGALR
jgi:protein-S-isoprenylcysteine O-methyltransferase Ste14